MFEPISMGSVASLWSTRNPFLLLSHQMAIICHGPTLNAWIATDRTRDVKYPLHRGSLHLPIHSLALACPPIRCLIAPVDHHGGRLVSPCICPCPRGCWPGTAPAASALHIFTRVRLNTASPKVCLAADICAPACRCSVGQTGQI